MDFIGGISLKEVGDALTSEGIGTAGGIVGGGFIGAKSEDYFVVPGSITSTSTLTDKLKGWAANNVPKIGLWYLMRRYDAATPLTADIKKGVMGSIVLDTIVRAGNNGVPIPTSILGYRILGAGPDINADVQKLRQENAVLKAEREQYIRQSAGAGAGQIRVQEVPGAPLPPPWPLTERSKREQTYGFMPGMQSAQYPEAVRRRQYGFMGEHQSASENIAKMFGML